MRDPFGAALYAATLLPFLSCILAYRHSPWRKHPIGKVIMGLLGSMCAILALGVTARTFGDNLVLLSLRVLFLVLLNIAGWALLWQILRIRGQAGSHPGRRASDYKEMS